MNEAFICDTVRLPRAKASPRGGLYDHTPTELLVHLHRSLQERTRLDRNAVDDVIIGCASQNVEQGANIAKTAALLGGWGDHVPGLTVNRFCASGVEAVYRAASRIRSGDADVVIAGGVESVDRFNPNGGTIAMGHAFGATGAISRMGVVDELERTGGKRGVAAVSGPAGLGVATLIERV